MDLEAVFTPIIGDFVKSLVSKGVTKLEGEKEIETLRLLLRERVRREARFNREVMDDAKLDLSVRIKNFRTDALDYVCGQPIPIAIIFNRELDKDWLLFLAGESAKHRMHFAGFKTEAHLIDRLLHRAKLAQLRVREGVSPGDVSYLKKLNNATHAAMMKM